MKQVEGLPTIAIIGLGLIGGSLGLALKRAQGPGVLVKGYSPRRQTLSLARSRGAIDREAENLGAAVAGAELVILATPIGALPQVMAGIAPHLAPDALVTDTASTKVQVMTWAQSHLPGVRFIGGHPMAGKESWGVEAAEGGLFQGAPYCLVPSPQTPRETIETLVKTVEEIGAKPFILGAEEHDRLVAGISHLPLLLSAALVLATTKSPSWPSLAQLAASGYRDLTRLASGNPQMSRDICLTNRSWVEHWLDRFLEELQGLRCLLAGGELEKAFLEARQAREKWLEERAV